MLNKIPAILSLPDDILWIILESDLLRHRDYFDLCFVRIFHPIALKLLYRHFPRHGNICMFLTKILQNTQLAAQVQSLDMPLRFKGPIGDVTIYCDSVVHLKCPRAMKLRWIESLRAGDYPAFASLLLVHLPQIRRLSLDSPPEPFYPVFGPPRYLAIRRSLTQSLDPSAGHHGWFLDSLGWPRAFLKLEEISIRGISSTINSISAVLGLPSVRKLFLAGLVDDSTHVKLEPRTSNVEQLTLSSIGVSVQYMAKLVLSCKSLKCFSYYAPVDDRVSRNLSDLFHALEASTESLEELEIRDLHDLRISHVSHSLLGFTSLRHLVCDAALLTCPSQLSKISTILPKTVQNFHIHNVNAEFWQHFGDLESIRKDLLQTLPSGALRFPSLHEVKLVSGSSLLGYNTVFIETFLDDYAESRLALGT